MFAPGHVCRFRPHGVVGHQIVNVHREPLGAEFACALAVDNLTVPLFIQQDAVAEAAAGQVELGNQPGRRDPAPGKPAGAIAPVPIKQVPSFLGSPAFRIRILPISGVFVLPPALEINLVQAGKIAQDKTMFGPQVQVDLGLDIIKVVRKAEIIGVVVGSGHHGGQIDDLIEICAPAREHVGTSETAPAGQRSLHQ